MRPHLPAVVLPALLAASSFAQISVREEKLTIPTWLIDPPAVHSLYPNPKGPIYPYTLNEILTDKKVEQAYNAVFLENEYIKVLVLPEIGGRIHGALDKTNNYKWLYWQPTIKPGLISMTGAWISGGIEWNFPHGHRPSGFMPVDHRIVKNPDGSGTVWVGETEPVYRMRWLVGITIFPGKSFIRCDYVFINPTDHKFPFQFWATAATHANEWAQAQYPGDMVTGHGKHEFWNWPINNGVDLTWWKNSPNASSYFAFNNPADWFGTYDHKAEGGLVHVADHRVMPGKKLWTWGSGPSGRIWEDILSEGGGAYFEPQAGAWSDNQPDYHWMNPQEVKIAHDYWYPVRNTRGYHNANADFAVNTDLKDGRAFAGVYATAPSKGQRVVLKNVKTGKVLIDEAVDLSPDRPFSREVESSKDATVYDLLLEVYGSKGDLRIDLRQQPPRKVELPAGQKDPGDPAKMNLDELYAAGEWLDKFVRQAEALTYYKEALKRDPADSRVNTEMGFIALKQGLWKEAGGRFAEAEKRDPDNSRIWFGKGLVSAGLGRYEEAYDQFFRATYTTELRPAAELNLARIRLRFKDVAGALRHLDNAARDNGPFADIPALRAAALRHAGKADDAQSAAQLALKLDPMHFMGSRELRLALQAAGKPAGDAANTHASIMRRAVQNYLELSCSYLSSGLLKDAEEVLSEAAGNAAADTVYPMVNYLRGFVRELQKDDAGAARFYAEATRGPAAGTNPHRLEELAALEAALLRNPKDAQAHLFAGNLLYARDRREEGFGHWKKAVEANPSLSLAWRNVGWGEGQLAGNPRSALEAYRKAVSLAPDDARAVLEMDEVAEGLKAPAVERLAMLEQHRNAVALRDDLTSRWIDLLLELGGPERLKAAYETLRTRHFHSWEGGYGIHDAWVEANQELGDLALDAKDYKVALKHYREACEYPKNLEVAARTPDLRSHVNWSLARVAKAMGNNDEANRYLKAILDEKYHKPHLGLYYQALARKAQGDEQGYLSALQALESQARTTTSGQFEYRGTPETIGHYLLSLVLQERGDTQGAAKERAAALERNPKAYRLALTEAQIDFAQAHQ
jgi:Tfp pilus assembly protein PilF